MAKSKAERGRFSSRKKVDAVLRVLRGEELDLVSRELGVTAATLSAWRDQFLAGGQASLKNRAADGRDAELARLKAVVGDLMRRRALAREAVQRRRGGLPLVAGRSTRCASHVAFPAASLWCGPGVPGVGRGPVAVLAPAVLCRGATPRAGQAGPDDVVHG
jgi:transposase-like protein